MSPFENFGRAPWNQDVPLSRPLLTQDSMTQKNADIYPCLEQDRTHYPNVKEMQYIRAPDRAATGTGIRLVVMIRVIYSELNNLTRWAI
jgi:hypothetical protein